MRKSFLRIALCLPLLTACTKEGVDFTNNASDSETGSLSLNLNTSELSSRLIMTESAASRSMGNVSYDVTTPVAPSMPSYSKTMPVNETLKNLKYSVSSYWNGTIDCGDGVSASIYIEGEMTVNGIDGNPSELCIYVLPGAKLIWNIKDVFNYLEVPAKNIIIKSWGEFTTSLVDNNGLKISKGASFHINDQINGFFEVEDLKVEGKMVSYSPLRVKKIAKFSNKANASFYADVEVNGKGKENVLDITGGSRVYFGGCTHVGGEPSEFGQDSDMKVDENSILEVYSYLGVNGVAYLSNGSRMNLLRNGAIFFNSQDMYIDEAESTVLTGGHVYTSAFCVKNADMRKEIKNINLYTPELKKGHDKYSPTLSWKELKLGGDNNSVCKIEFTVPTCSLVEMEELQLEEIAQIMPPGKDARYSATSVDFYGNRSYISWHTNPKYTDREFGGVLDIVNIQDRTFEASLVNEHVKYNHALWHSGTMYLAGESDAKGALLCKIVMNDNGSFPVSVSENVVTLNGRSGNCVTAIDDNTLITASSGDATRQGGFNLFNKDIEKLDETSFFAKAEKAKYTYRMGNELLTLEDMNLGIVKLYDLSAGGDLSSVLASPKKVYRAGRIEPQDGKNVCTFDDKYVYVCMGENGLKIYQKDGWPLGVYNIQQVNGVDSDESYIYVAHGYGVSVIDKSTGRIITSRNKDKNSASANFVRKGADGRIYVAYGTSGLKVFSLR